MTSTPSPEAFKNAGVVIAAIRIEMAQEQADREARHDDGID
jgi:hypothetical protein